MNFTHSSFKRGPIGHTESLVAGAFEPKRGLERHPHVDAIDRWEGELLRRRENIPLAVMSVASLAVLFFLLLGDRDADRSTTS